VKIEVLGSGCCNCKQLEENVRKACIELKKKAQISHVTDFAEIASYGVMSTPALVVDGKIKSTGRVPDVAEIKKWL